MGNKTINIMDPWWLMLDVLYRKAISGDKHSKDMYESMDAETREYYEDNIPHFRMLIGYMLRENNDYKELAKKLGVSYSDYPDTLIR